MTSRRWGFFATLAIAVFGTASLALSVVAYLKRLPDPETADRRGVFRWLVESDLRDEPAEIRWVVMRRVEGELIKGIDFREIASKLNGAQRRKLFENADFLAGLWFRGQADRYFGASTTDRPNVLGDQIAEIHRLGIMDQLSALENASLANGAAATTAATLATRIDRWLAEASPHERPRLAKYFAALRDRIFWDGIQDAANARNWLPL
jgi:hypothetical protein